MPELAEVKPTKTVGFVDRGYNYELKRKRIEEDEEEIKRLEAEQAGETESEEQQEEATEETEANSENEEKALSGEEKSFKKRYGDLRRHTQKKEKEWEDKLEALKNKSTREGIAPPKSDEDIEEWAKEHPDVAGIVETIAAKKAQEMFEKADSRLKELDAINSQAERGKSENEIRNSHSDFDELRESDSFHDWVEEQPKWVQDALYENSDDARSVVRVIDLYKSDKGLTKEARKGKTKAAASAIVKNSKADIDGDDMAGSISESEVKKMSTQEFEKREVEITKAIQTGKFIYDLSGSAR